MKVFVVFNINRDILGVVTSLENAEKLYNEKYVKDYWGFSEDRYLEFELDKLNNSEILKLFAKELIPKMTEFVNGQYDSLDEIYASRKDLCRDFVNEFLEFIDLEERLMVPKPEKRIRKKVKLSEELENF